MSWILNITFMPFAKKPASITRPSFYDWADVASNPSFAESQRQLGGGSGWEQKPTYLWLFYHPCTPPPSNSGMSGFLEVDQIESISIPGFFFFFGWSKQSPRALKQQKPSSPAAPSPPHHADSAALFCGKQNTPKTKQGFPLGTHKLISWKWHATPGCVGI